MAIGVASNFQIYNAQFWGGFTEELAQSTAPLTGAGIRVTARPVAGHYELQSFVKAIAGLVSRRDITSVAAATDTALTMGENASVKLSRKIGPVAQAVDALRKAALPFVADWDATGEQGLSRYLGGQIAKAQAIDMLDAALLALRTFLENANTNSNRHVIATNGTMTNAALVTALGLLGDASQQVAAWVMHSKVYFDLLALQTALATGGTDMAFGTMMSGTPISLNRPILVSDSASLVVTGSPNLYRTLGLVDGAAELVTSEEQTLVSDLVTGLEQLVVRLQGEFAYNLGVKGATWDMANGGANPNPTALGTATNWDMVATDKRELAGVVIISG
ncbi:MAG: hypothetical protein JZU52_12670 [Lamprocystis purpurea]|jgi:hypothetical protein|uniref:major capsid protein n=1 Tax=Lamprocystis purpurea TaxID=61598 RepID=UPI00036A0B95|nr:major capsid protein [Lamprocystis purpurea]MBV5274449.1 hypothetical protein [Lamprocystis purpurea]